MMFSCSFFQRYHSPFMNAPCATTTSPGSPSSRGAEHEAVDPTTKWAAEGGGGVVLLNLSRLHNHISFAKFFRKSGFRWAQKCFFFGLMSPRWIKKTRHIFALYRKNRGKTERIHGAAKKNPLFRGVRKKKVQLSSQSSFSNAFS